jgi:hypothetical protein
MARPYSLGLRARAVARVAAGESVLRLEIARVPNDAGLHHALGLSSWFSTAPPTIALATSCFPVISRCSSCLLMRQSSTRRKISGMKSARKSSRTTPSNPSAPCAPSSGRRSSYRAQSRNRGASQPASGDRARAGKNGCRLRRAQLRCHTQRSRKDAAERQRISRRCISGFCRYRCCE